MYAKNQDIHHVLVSSPWPALAALGALISALGAVGLMQRLGGNELLLFNLNVSNSFVLSIGLFLLLVASLAWWMDVVREAGLGYHTPTVQSYFRYGMCALLLVEAMFFVAWFWAFFDSALSVADVRQPWKLEHTHGMWPPDGIGVLEPWGLPLINTLILLLSGTSVVWAEFSLGRKDIREFKLALTTSVVLGILFVVIQAVEYRLASFPFVDSIYGSTFFMITGLHGLHVLIGIVMLLVCLVRAILGRFCVDNHLGFQLSAWYWHFVDIVWLALFICVYIFGSSVLVR